MQGALVANYPWDGSKDRGTHYEACPDDAAYVHLAHIYASSHVKMATPGSEFNEGITNGAAWYPLWGGMQVRSMHCGCTLLCMLGTNRLFAARRVHGLLLALSTQQSHARLH